MLAHVLQIRSMLVISTYNLRDLKEIMPLAARTLGEDYSPGIYSAIFQNFPQGFVVARQEDRVIGFCIMVPDVDSLRILMLSVHENHRKKGIGSALLKEALARMLSLNYKKLTLEVRETSHESIAFYKKLGFRIDSLLSGYYSNGDNAYRMEMDIG